MLNSPFSETENLKVIAGFDFLDVCLLGETGTGKTHFARLIHELSPRRARPFIAVNCAELSRSVIEAELFGYEKGAFTGAVASNTGKFEAATGGTLFLDEIGELNREMQAKLLKVVEEKSVTRVGSVVPRPLNLRIIYATNRDLNVFREDLRYRVAAHTIRLKPLRERLEEITPLAQLFINDFCRKSGREITAGKDALQILKNADWRGNVRELRTFIEKACLDALFLADRRKFPHGASPLAAELTAEIFLFRLTGGEGSSGKARLVGETNELTNGDDVADYRQEIKDYDRRLIKRTLEKNRQNVSRTATELGLSRYGLIKKIKRYKI